MDQDGIFRCWEIFWAECFWRTETNIFWSIFMTFRIAPWSSWENSTWLWVLPEHYLTNVFELRTCLFVVFCLYQVINNNQQILLVVIPNLDVSVTSWFNLHKYRHEPLSCKFISGTFDSSNWEFPTNKKFKSKNLSFIGNAERGHKANRGFCLLALTVNFALSINRIFSSSKIVIKVFSETNDNNLLWINNEHVMEIVLKVYSVDRSWSKRVFENLLEFTSY